MDLLMTQNSLVVSPPRATLTEV